MNRIGLWISSLLVVLALLSSTLFVVDQRQFGVVYALGQIKEVITEPGLHFKLPPPLQNVNYIDKRLLTLDSPNNEPMLTAEKQRVVIDWYVRWRITDPQAYIRNVGLDEKAGTNQLNRVVRNAFQEQINKRTVKELLSLKREELMDDVKDDVLVVVRGAKPWGAVLRIVVADDLACGLVVSDHAGGRRVDANADRLAVNLDLVTVLHALAHMGGLVVHSDPAFGDEFFHLQARTHTGLGQHLVQFGRVGLRREHALAEALRHLFGRLLVVELARDHIGQVNRPVRSRGRLGHSGRARLAGSVHARALALCIGGGIVHVGVFSWPRPVLAGSASARLAVSAKASSSDRLACAGDSSSMPARADMGEST